jgi:hypothetical protein
LVGCGNLGVTAETATDEESTGSDEDGACAEAKPVECGWEFALGRTLPSDLAIGSCGAFYVAYASAFDYEQEVALDNEIRKYDAAQNEVWAHSLDDHALSSLVATSRDTLVVATRLDAIHRLVAIDTDGTRAWQHELVGLVTDLATDAEGRIAAVGQKGDCDCGYVTVLDEHGQLLWSDEQREGVSGRAVDFGPGGDVIVGGSQDGSGWLARFDGSGQLLWESIIEGAVQRLTVDETGSIYTAVGASIRRYSSAGEPIWSKTVDPDDGVPSVASIDVGAGAVHSLVNSEQNGPSVFEPPLYYNGVLNPDDGAVEWNELIDGAPLELIVSPAEHVYVLSDAGLLGTHVSCQPG